MLVFAIIAIRSFSARSNSEGISTLKNYKRLDLTDVSQFNSRIFRKQFVALPNKRGIVLDLNQVYSSPLIEIVFSDGDWNIQFMRYDYIIAETQITVNNQRQIITVPTEALGGYDTLAMVPLNGRNQFIAYLRPIDSYERNVLETTTIITNPYEGSTQHDLSGAIGYFDTDNGTNISLKVLSISELDVLLLNIVTENGKIVAEFPDNSILETSNTSDLWFYTFTATKTGREYLLAELYLQYRYINEDGSTDQNEVKTEQIDPFKPYDKEVYNSTEIRTHDNLATFDFVRQNGETVSFDGRNIKLNQMLFIPKGKRLVLEAGQTIDLSNGASIICRDAVEFNGTKSEPVKIISSDGTGDGVVVLQANKGLGRSKINYLICDNLDFIENGIYYLTGCITFYESDVDFYGCQFLNNKSEDGLNVIRSDMTAKNCTFCNAYQDAFDSDFCTGLFENCHFELTGNDAFDISTSTYTVKDCTFKDIHDKCLSIGENSTAAIEGINANNAQAIIGAKDLSTVHAKNLSGKDVFIGYLAYQKKPEFGHSTTYLENMQLTGATDFDYLIEADETFYLDGVRKYSNGKKMEALIIEKIKNEEPILR